MSADQSRAKRVLTRSRLSIATALVLYGANAFGSASLLTSSANADHVLLPPGIYAGNEPGLELVQDYGTLQLWRVDAAHRHELNSVARNSAKLQNRAILFEAGDFDPSQPLRVPAAFGVGKGDGPQIHLVQLNGPVTDDLMAAITGSGALVIASLSGNTYAVLADDSTASRIVSAAGSHPLMRAVTTLPGFYKLAGGLSARAEAGLSPGTELDVTVQIARHGASGASKGVIESLHRGGNSLTWDNRLTKESLRLRIVETDLVTIAGLPDVFAVEPYTERRKFDEVQAQIVAGNFDGAQTGPSGPGYRAWLAGRGFPTTAASYPIVDVVDDGLGTGTAVNGGGDETFTALGDGVTTRLASVFNCTADALGDGRGGHGHINTNIVGGYDDRGDAGGIQGPFEDPDGFLRGQGINPYTRLAHTKIFRNAGAYDVSACGNTDAGLIRSSQDRGAPITSNSWGASVGGNYDDSSEAYDIGTRDGDLTEAGHQPMIHIFAAGNSGSGAGTIGSPSTGKNMITVGASENDRPGPDESGPWTDGCGVGASGANNAMDVIGFSSRGPAEGGRTKPEVIAPGTHIQGTASTAVGYTGDSVCDQFRPLAQTTFASSSGTSHSTPAIAGVASLMYYWMQTEHSIAAPSSAAMKAYMMAHPTYLTGVSANDNLPSNSQGFGMPNLRQAFDNTTQTTVVDQTTVFGATGETFPFAGGVADPAKPVRIALAWTDAPGAISDTTPQVNDLNLTAVVNGVTYTGNRFTGRFSTAGGGAADTANNYEAIFLPAGTTGSVQITVTAAGIVGDGIPGNADLTDQDFALVVSNVAQTPDFFVAATPTSAQTCGADSEPFSVTAGEFNGYDGTVTLSTPSLPPGITTMFAPASGMTPYTSTMTATTTGGLASGNYPFTIEGFDGTNTRTAAVTIQHSATASAATTLTAPANAATDVSTTPTFSWQAAAGALGYVLEVDNNSDFSSIEYTTTVSGTSHTPPTGLSGATTYFWRVRSTNNCGPSANSPVFSFTTVPVFCATPNLAIPDNVPAGVSSTINVINTGVLTDLDVDVQITHTWIGDLIYTLRHVDTNTTVVLLDRPGRTTTGFGCNGDNPDIILDDEGSINGETGCTNTNPGYPIGARVIPNNPLAGFDTQSLGGAWTLTISDNAGGDLGTLVEWCLNPTLTAAGVTANDDSFPGTEDTQLNVPAPGVLGNDTGAGLTATLNAPPSNGTLVGGLAANGSFSFLPADDFCGADTFTYTATDGTNSDMATVTLQIACVNDAPVADDDAFTTFEDTPLSVAAPGVLDNDSDVDSMTLTAALVASAPNGVTAVGMDGSVSYTPAQDFCTDPGTTDDFTYTANDGTLNSNVATGAITVTCVNDAPSEDTAIDDTTATATFAFSLDVAPNFSDVEGDTITFTATGLPASMSISPAGVISGTPTEGEVAVYTVTVTADDGTDTTDATPFDLEVLPIDIFSDGFED